MNRTKAQARTEALTMAMLLAMLLAAVWAGVYQAQEFRDRNAACRTAVLAYQAAQPNPSAASRCLGN